MSRSVFINVLLVCLRGSAIDGSGAADWLRLVIDRWLHRDFGGGSNMISSSFVASQLCAPNIYGYVQSRGASVGWGGWGGGRGSRWLMDEPAETAGCSTSHSLAVVNGLDVLRGEEAHVSMTTAPPAQ